ncbi:MAG: TlpA family protein disulfide reductase [Myxococcota bacterium]
MRWVVSLSVAGCIPVLHSEDGGAASEWVAPENGWPISEPPAGLEAEGYEDGQVVPDVRGIDVYGDEVSLWQFYGSLVVLDLSTQWCSPCRELAEGVQETADHFGEELVYVTLMPEDTEGEPVDEEDLADWAEYYGIVTEPVLADPEGYAYDVVPPGSVEGWPAVFVVDRDLRVHERVGEPTDANIRAVVTEIL